MVKKDVCERCPIDFLECTLGDSTKEKCNNCKCMDCTYGEPLCTSKDLGDEE